MEKCRINIFTQREPTDKPVILKTNHSETPKEWRNRRNKNKKMNRHHKKLVKKINNAHGI